MTINEWTNAFSTELWTSMADDREEPFRPQPSGELVFGHHTIAFRPLNDDGRTIRIIATHHAAPLTPAFARDDTSWSATTADEPRLIARDVAHWLSSRRH